MIKFRKGFVKGFKMQDNHKDCENKPVNIKPVIICRAFLFCVFHNI